MTSFEMEHVVDLQGSTVKATASPFLTRNVKEAQLDRHQSVEKLLSKPNAPEKKTYPLRELDNMFLWACITKLSHLPDDKIINILKAPEWLHGKDEVQVHIDMEHSRGQDLVSSNQCEFCCKHGITNDERFKDVVTHTIRSAYVVIYLMTKDKYTCSIDHPLVDSAQYDSCLNGAKYLNVFKDGIVPLTKIKKSNPKRAFAVLAVRQLQSAARVIDGKDTPIEIAKSFLEKSVELLDRLME